MDGNIQINVIFFETYKRLEKLCKDKFSNDEGVSEYIRQMEDAKNKFQIYNVSWEEDYKSLKHIRWIRNQLSHEEGTFLSDTCSQNDLRFVKCFIEKITSGTDPLARLKRREENERMKRAQTRERVYAVKPIEQEQEQIKENKKSLFERCKEKIKRLFS